MQNTDFENSYLGKLRQVVGNRLLQVPGARVVIQRNDGFILLEKRKDFKVWGVPSGSAEESEDLISAMKREVYEETGLKISNFTIFGFASNPSFEVIEYPCGDKIHSFSLLFYTNDFYGDLTSNLEESDALEWFDLEKLPKLLPNMERTINAYLKFSKNGEFQVI